MHFLQRKIIMTVMSIVECKMIITRSVCYVDWYSFGVGIFVLQEAVLTTRHNLVKHTSPYSTVKETYTIGILLCMT